MLCGSVATGRRASFGVVVVFCGVCAATCLVAGGMACVERMQATCRALPCIGMWCAKLCPSPPQIYSKENGSAVPARAILLSVIMGF
mmetsp:Transcript_27349/g.60497  ORF Transcript_27349/g.60497 Transcript_27349/m.60497 type:complete len:87 (+) Transcript_27349:570-830(+)